MPRRGIKTIIGLMASAVLVVAGCAQIGPGGPYPPSRRHTSPDDRAYNPRPPAPPPQRDARAPWRDTRPGARWDPSQHNGYYLANTWHVGPPPEGVYRQPGFTPGYKPWERGDKLGYYNSRYTVVDHRQHRLREPPRGYHWVQDDRGDFLLVAIATGLIASVIFAATH